MAEDPAEAGAASEFGIDIDSECVCAAVGVGGVSAEDERGSGDVGGGI